MEERRILGHLPPHLAGWVGPVQYITIYIFWLVLLQTASSSSYLRVSTDSRLQTGSVARTSHTYTHTSVARWLGGSLAGRPGSQDPGPCCATVAAAPDFNFSLALFSPRAQRPEPKRMILNALFGSFILGTLRLKAQETDISHKATLRLCRERADATWLAPRVIASAGRAKPGRTGLPSGPCADHGVLGQFELLHAAGATPTFGRRAGGARPCALAATLCSAPSCLRCWHRGLAGHETSAAKAHEPATLED